MGVSVAEGEGMALGVNAALAVEVRICGLMVGVGERVGVAAPWALKTT